MLVEPVDKYEDKDEDVDADQTRTGRPVGLQESTKEIEKGTLFDHENVKHSTRTGRPVSGLESTQSCVLMPTKIEE